MHQFHIAFMQLVWAMAQFYSAGGDLEFLKDSVLNFSKIGAGKFVSRVCFYWLTAIENS